MIDIVITMAGLGSRFKEAGYNVPKYMIEAHGKTLFEWSMLSLTDYFSHTECIHFIVRKEDNAKEFIEIKSKQFTKNKLNIIEIDYLTAGQAATCNLARTSWNKDNGLVVYNIDTYVEPYIMKYSDIKGDGLIPCFKGEGDHWSFVAVNDEFKALEVKEKKRISPYCSVGLYYFKTCSLYEKMYNECYINKKIQLEKNEEYIAPMYDYMIKNNYDIYISCIDAKSIHALGTPKELEIFLKEYDK